MSENRKNSSDRTDINEKKSEQMLARIVKVAGGICPRLISSGMDGMPGHMGGEVRRPQGAVQYCRAAQKQMNYHQKNREAKLII